MKFGVREICNVVFKTTADKQRIGDKVFNYAGMPAFMIDTAKTSSLEQASTTVYAQGGRGNNRLIAWEGEKTLTFTLEDALISPMGLAVLSGAGLIAPTGEKPMHVHCTIDGAIQNIAASGDPVNVVTVDIDDLNRETGLEATSFLICNKTPAYATVLDGSGAGIDFCDTVTLVDASGDAISPETSPTVEVAAAAGQTAAKKAYFKVQKSTGPDTADNVTSGTVQLDFYLVMTNSAAVQEIEIKPEDFGGYFYIEAQTLFRREDTGKDMAAEIILPKVKVQSGFTFTMASSGDPSTFTFTMDAFPGYTQFDKTKKVMCVMQVLGVDEAAASAGTTHEHSSLGTTPSFQTGS